MYQTRPDDYAAFRCLAGACPQTCCAAWEIVVDPDAQDAYLRLQHPLAAKLRRARSLVFKLKSCKAFPILSSLASNRMSSSSCNAYKTRR